jgi:excisionase family DNA binding protein
MNTTLLTPSEAARIAGVSADSIRSWLRSGRLASTATPLGRLIDPYALDQLISEREAARRRRRG